VLYEKHSVTFLQQLMKVKRFQYFQHTNQSTHTNIFSTPINQHTPIFSAHQSINTHQYFQYTNQPTHTNIFSTPINQHTPTFSAHQSINTHHKILHFVFTSSSEWINYMYTLWLGSTNFLKTKNFKNLGVRRVT
jgi:hypothetical protein